MLDPVEQDLRDIRTRLDALEKQGNELARLTDKIVIAGVVLFVLLALWQGW